ncbi:MAG: hypothetical protein ACI3VQ_01585, partial [Faecousia sp.]
IGQLRAFNAKTLVPQGKISNWSNSVRSQSSPSRTPVLQALILFNLFFKSPKSGGFRAFSFV